MSQYPQVPISDDEIKLGQFIKLASLVATGGEAKEVIANGQVQVNGEVETRRGRTLRPGDTVAIGSVGAEVAHVDEDDDYFDEATADDDFDPEKWRNM